MEMGAHSFLKDVESAEEVASPSLPTASTRISDGRDPSVSWSDFDALVRKTSALHDRLEQVLEKQQEYDKKTSWTEFVSLLSVGEKEGEDANKDATITTLNTSDASSRSDRIIHCQRRDSYVRDQLSDGTITSIHYELPESLFSLIITEDICSVPFFAGMLGAALSVMCLVLVLLDEFSKKVPGNSLGLPAGLHPSVQVAQYLGVIIGVLMEHEIPAGLEVIGKGLEQEVTGGTNLKFRRIVFSSLLRLAVGYLFLLCLFLVVVQESTVLGIFFDVLALEFVENIDDVSFLLMKRGFFGKRLREATNTLPCIVVKKKIHALGRWTKRCIKIIYFLNACFGIAFLTYFTVKQEEGTYRCTMVTVSFGDVMWEHALVKHAGGELETKLLMYSHFNGVYEEDGLFDGRPRYVERNKVHGDPYDRVIPAEIVFCNEVQAWVFRHEDIRTSIDEDNENPCSWLFKSQATASFDIIKLAKDSDWSVWRGVIEPKHSLSIECTQCEDRSACNYNGQCLESKCICNEGYFGELCQFERPCYQIRSEKDINTTLELLPYNDASDEDNNFFVSYGRPIYVARNMTGMPYTLLRLGYPEIGDEYYEIEYGNSTSIFGSGDIPPHKHIEPTFFEDDDFFELNFKNDKDEFEQLLENYTFYLHFTGRRWYGDLSRPEMDVKIFNEGGEYHAFWDDAFSAIGVADNTTLIFSAPTNGISPAGVDFFETRRRNIVFDDDFHEYDYDPFGVLIPLVQYQGNGIFSLQ